MEKTETARYAAQIERLLAVENIQRDTVSLRSVTGKKARHMFLPSQDALVQFMRDGAIDEPGDDGDLPRHIVLCIVLSHPAVFSRAAQGIPWLGRWSRRNGMGFAIAQYFAMRQGVVFNHVEDTVSFGFRVAGRRHGLSIDIRQPPATSAMLPRDAIADDGRSTIRETSLQFHDRGREVPGSIQLMRFGVGLVMVPSAPSNGLSLWTWAARTNKFFFFGRRDGSFRGECLKCGTCYFSCVERGIPECVNKCHRFPEIQDIPTSLQDAVYIYYNTLIAEILSGKYRLSPPLTMLRRKKLAREAADKRCREKQKALVLKWGSLRDQIEKRRLEDAHDEEERLKRMRTSE